MNSCRKNRLLTNSGTYHQFVAENSPCSEVGEQQAHERQCDGGPETLRMERKFGKDPPTEEIIGRFHNRRTDQQHDLHNTMNCILFW